MPDSNPKYFEELFIDDKKKQGIFSRLFSKAKYIPAFCGVCRMTIDKEKLRAEHMKNCKKLHIVMFSRFATMSKIKQLKLLEDPVNKQNLELCLKLKVKLEKILAVENTKWQHKYGTPLEQSLGIKLRDFEFIKPLTKGGYGQIFLLKDRITGKEMAGKIISISEAIQRNCLESYVLERDMLLKCKSEFIVKLYYSFRSEFFIYQIMEFVPNGDLSAYLEIVGCFSEDTVKSILVQLLLALKELKIKKIVHGDIKLENILYSADLGTVKLADFGLAFQTTDSHRKASLGTPEYMAPEQILELKKGFESDMWAFGVCAYEMLCGIPPFYSENADEILNLISKKANEIEWIKKLAPIAKNLIERILCYDASARCTVEEAMNHEFFKGINWSKPPKVNLPKFENIYEERNKRYNSFKYYNLNTISTETVAFEEGVFNQHTSIPNQIELLKIFPIKNLNALQ